MRHHDIRTPSTCHAEYVTLECDYCKSHFQRRASIVRKERKKGRTRTFCSLHCAASAPRDPTSPKPTVRQLTCKQCDVSFDRTIKHGYPAPEYCSKACASRANGEIGRSKRRVHPAPVGEKYCPHCHQVKLQELFSKNRSGTIYSWCKECCAKVAREARAIQPKAPRRKRVSASEYRQANKARIYKSKQEYKRLNPEKWKEQQLRGRTRFAEKHPFYSREVYQRRRAACHGGVVTKQELSIIVEKYGFVCYICDTQLDKITTTFDHVIPLFHGGEHSVKNLRPCCKSCNSSKGKWLWHELAERNPKMARRIRDAIIS